ncbi:MAG: dihydropteroate synthase [Deltaproteobacteria bacterium]|nr:dihydropteroate synthase [Deltaproteobacteria bacterium]
MKFYVVGILNVTPDSFYDGGRYHVEEKAFERALKMVEEGADILDVGGESTRPGSKRVECQEEIKRVIPVIERLAREVCVPLSIDTTKSEVAQRAIGAGASLVNDISGFTMDPQMPSVVSKGKVNVILSHIQGTPKDMQKNPMYENVTRDIMAFFKKQMDLGLEKGISKDKIILDPGIGFGKSVEHNLQILREFDLFLELGRPLMIGTSRKSFIGKIQKDRGPEERLAGSLMTAAWAYQKGATYFRAHDVCETKRALTMAAQLMKKGDPPPPSG